MSKKVFYGVALSVLFGIVIFIASLILMCLWLDIDDLKGKPMNALKVLNISDFKMMYKEYEDNELNFESMYEDKFYVVKGDILQISDGIWITIDVKVADEIVYCEFSQDDKKIISKFKKGDSLSVVGKLYFAFESFRFSDCSFIE